MANFGQVSGFVIPGPDEIADFYVDEVIKIKCNKAFWREKIAQALVDIYASLSPSGQVEVVDYGGASLPPVTIDPPTLANEEDWRPVLASIYNAEYMFNQILFALATGVDGASMTITQASGSGVSSTITITDNHITVVLGTNPGGQPLIDTIDDFLTFYSADPDAPSIITASSSQPTQPLNLASGQTVEFALSLATFRLSAGQLGSTVSDPVFYAPVAQNEGIFQYFFLLQQLYGMTYYTRQELEDLVNQVASFKTAPFNFIVRGSWTTCGGTFGVNVPILFQQGDACTYILGDFTTALNKANQIGVGEYYRYPVDDVTSPCYIHMITKEREWMNNDPNTAALGPFDNIVSDAYFYNSRTLFNPCNVCCNFELKAAWNGLVNTVTNYTTGESWIDSILNSCCCAGPPPYEAGQVRGIIDLAWVDAGLDSAAGEEQATARKQYDYYRDAFVQAVIHACGAGPTRRRIAPACC